MNADAVPEVLVAQAQALELAPIIPEEPFVELDNLDEDDDLWLERMDDERNELLYTKYRAIDDLWSANIEWAYKSVPPYVAPTLVECEVAPGTETDTLAHQIEVLYENMNISKMIIFNGPDAADTDEDLIQALADKSHTVIHITEDMLEDERPRHLARLREFESGWARVLVTTQDMWSSVLSKEVSLGHYEKNVLFVIAAQDRAQLMESVEHMLEPGSTNYILVART